MSILYSSKQAYSNGINAFQNNDLITARHWFEIAYHDPSLSEKVLPHLIKIELKDGKYVEDRNQIEDQNANHFEISNMYPVLLSDEFDKEKNSKNMELKQKRMRGNIK